MANYFYPDLTPSGPLGDVDGPSSSNDSALALFDGLTGKLIKNSSWALGEEGTMIGQSLSVKGDSYLFQQVQVPQNPLAALASPAAPGNVSNGAHSYKVTYVLNSGHETDGGAESNTVTIVDKTINGKIELTAISISMHPDVVSKNIYRDKNGDLVYKLVANIPNATVSYTDNIADASLGATIPMFNQTGRTWHPGYMQIGGVEVDTPPNILGDSANIEIGSSGLNIGNIQLNSDDNFVNPFTGFLAFGVPSRVFDFTLEGGPGVGGVGRRIFTTNDSVGYNIDAYIGSANVTQGGIKYTIYKTNGVGGTANLSATDVAFNISQKSGNIFNLLGTGNLDLGGRLKTVGNVLVGADSAGANAAKNLVLQNNATAPSSSQDLAHLYCADISAGNATLAIYTETAVAADIGLASTNSLTIFINGTKYKLPLVAA